MEVKAQPFGIDPGARGLLDFPATDIRLCSGGRLRFVLVSAVLDERAVIQLGNGLA